MRLTAKPLPTNTHSHDRTLCSELLVVHTALQQSTAIVVTHQMRVHEDGRKFTSFVTEDEFYECLWVSFGLKNAPSHFQRMVDSILRMYRLDFALAYIDDIIIYSKTLKEHLKHVNRVLEALHSVRMTIVEEKYHFTYNNIKMLGHRVGRLRLSIFKE